MEHEKIYSDLEEIKKNLIICNGKEIGKLLRMAIKMKKQLIKDNKKREEEIE